MPLSALVLNGLVLIYTLVVWHVDKPEEKVTAS